MPKRSAPNPPVRDAAGEKARLLARRRKIAGLKKRVGSGTFLADAVLGSLAEKLAQHFEGEVADL